jgi:hypothetical protein
VTKLNLGDGELAWARYAVNYVADLQNLKGPLPYELVRLRQRLELTASVNGSESDSGTEESEPQDLIDTFEAGEILRCSPRWVREISADLGGRQVGREWVFRRQDVVEYARLKGSGHGGTGRDVGDRHRGLSA